MRCLGMFLRCSGIPSESVARERSSHRLSIMVRAVAATLLAILDVMMSAMGLAPSVDVFEHLIH